MHALFLMQPHGHHWPEVKIQIQLWEGHHIPPCMFQMLMRPQGEASCTCIVSFFDWRGLSRSGILECFNLKLADFGTVDEANKVAEHFISKQREHWGPAYLEQYPDQLCAEFPAADLFWFSNYKGRGGRSGMAVAVYLFGWFVCLISLVYCVWWLGCVVILILFCFTWVVLCVGC